MARGGRPLKAGKRAKSGRLSRAKKLLEEALAGDPDKGVPNNRVLERRVLFSFVRVPVEERQDGRNGEVDSEVCDAIGQFHALGLLSGHGHDPTEIRDRGRFWGMHLAALTKALGMRTANFEPSSRTTASAPKQTTADILFDRMDEALCGYERSVLRSILVDPLIGSYPDGREFPFWAQSLVDEALLERGRIIPSPCFPTEHERGMMKAAIRGLCILVDAALPPRFARMAA